MGKERELEISSTKNQKKPSGKIGKSLVSLFNNLDTQTNAKKPDTGF